MRATTMARAVSIWVVTEHYGNAAEPQAVAAFTVKHELVTWLERKSPEARRDLTLTKMPDNPTYAEMYGNRLALEDLSITELLDTERRARERAEERDAIWRRSVAFDRRD
jgi:hypothetical protein